MPRKDCIAFFFVSGLLLSCLTSIATHANPRVLAYERFHAQKPSIEGGRILYNELGCANCHAPETGLPDRHGPLLQGIIERRQIGWLETFLRDPLLVQPGSTMPRMRLRDKEIEALIHYLASLPNAKPVPGAFRFVNADRGKKLYHSIGCVACHTPNPGTDSIPKTDNKDATSSGIALSNLGKKYDFNSLSAFIARPHDTWPLGRMPQFRFEREDSGDLSAFLLDYRNGDSTEYTDIPKFEVDSRLAGIGKIVFELRSCVQCHQAPGIPLGALKLPALQAASMDNFKELPGHPYYHLSDDQTESIRQFLSANPQAKDPALAHFKVLNCLSCHERDDLGGPEREKREYFIGDDDLGDAGRFPPPLTGIGRKLIPDWLAQALRGKKTIRPYLRTQMPVFGKSILGLEAILSEADKQEVTPDFPEGDLEAGRQLLGTEGGLNCITCHDWEENPSLGIRALNIGNMAERLQLGWLAEYLVAPAQYRPHSLMPSFWPSGMAANKTILDGDTQAQIASIYAYSDKGEGKPPGFPDFNPFDFEIVPQDRPVVQRAFMEGIGTHAILVGFPEGIHLAFDAATGQPAMLWKGRFFDAYRTWFSRFISFENPLGESIVRWPNPPQESRPVFQGYRLDKQGIPEFEMVFNDHPLFERVIPLELEDGSLVLTRRVRYTEEGQMATHSVTHPESASVETLESSDPLTEIFQYRW